MTQLYPSTTAAGTRHAKASAAKRLRSNAHPVGNRESTRAGGNADAGRLIGIDSFWRPFGRLPDRRLTLELRLIRKKWFLQCAEMLPRPACGSFLFKTKDKANITKAAIPSTQKVSM